MPRGVRISRILVIRPWDPGSLQYHIGVAASICKGYSELTLIFTRIKNALSKLIFRANGRFNIWKFELVCALWSSSKFQMICRRGIFCRILAQFAQPVIRWYPNGQLKKNVECRICRNCTTSEGNLCQREEPYFFASQKINCREKTTFFCYGPLVNND